MFCNRNTDPLLANVSGVIEVINCQQNISANLNWYVRTYVRVCDCVCVCVCVCMHIPQFNK